MIRKAKGVVKVLDCTGLFGARDNSYVAGNFRHVIVDNLIQACIEKGSGRIHLSWG